MLKQHRMHKIPNEELEEYDLDQNSIGDLSVDPSSYYH